MKIKDEHAIILFPLIGGPLLWAAAAAIDSLLFSPAPFPDSLQFYFSSPELFSRALFFSGFVLFGMMAQRMLTKQLRTAERYKGLVELSGDLVTITDKDGKCVYLNAAAYRMLERSPEEVIGKSFSELLHHEDRIKYLKKLEEPAKASTDTFLFENRYLTKRGKAIDVVQNVSVLRDARRKIIGTRSSAKDVTERRQVDELLRKAVARAEEEKGRLESLLSSMDDGISIQDRDFRVLYQNQAYVKMVGGVHGEDYCYRAYARADSPCPGCPLEKAFQDGQRHELEKELSLNNEIRFMEIKASPLRDASGTVVAGIEIVRDITACRNAEAKLRMFSVAIEDAMDGIQIIDMDGHIVYSNKAVRELFGSLHEELAGQHIGDMFADRGASLRSVLPSIGEHGRWSGEFAAVHKDGRTIPVGLSLSVVKGEQGRPIAMIGTLQDLTDRKHEQELVQRQQELLTRSVEERTRELLATNETLRRVIADREKMEQELLKSQKLELLTFSTKGAATVKKTVSISDLVRDVTGFMTRDNRIKLFFSLPADLRTVDIDEDQISQALHNIVINADHAMPGGGTITISCENEIVSASSNLPLSPGEYVRINVRDHGVGIPQVNLSKIFDPYFTTKQKGSGFGLATSYSIIKRHGGHILAESDPGNGATFIIYLPASIPGQASKRTDEMKMFMGTGNTAEG